LLLLLVLLLLLLLLFLPPPLAWLDPGDWIRVYYSFDSNTVYHFETFCQKIKVL
jgi:hypothetical protein